MSDLDGTGTAWAEDPERVDPEDYPAGSQWVKLFTWAPCLQCDLQVHSPFGLAVLRGVRCPRCSAPLLAPAEDGMETLRRVLRYEDEMTEQL